MDVDLVLQLQSRLDDRVIVALRIMPGARCHALIEGAALQLVDAQGEELCPRHLVPVPVRVSQVVDLHVELRGEGPLPDGARVVAIAWAGTEQVQASCPAEPFVSLREHMRGSRLGLPDEQEVLLTVLSPSARTRLENLAPWVANPVRRPEVSGVIEATEPNPTAEDLARDFDLDGDTASWLEGLLEGEDA